MSRLLIVAILAPALLVVADAASATTAGGDLYQGRTIVTGRGEESRARGFADCLLEVLVKVAGDPTLVGGPGIARLVKEAGALVRSFDYRDRMEGIPVHDEQGTRDRPYDLTVRFEPQKIDAALRGLGHEPWTGSRPRVAVFVGVRTGDTTYVLARDGERGRDQRDALAVSADRLGLSVVLSPDGTPGTTGPGNGMSMAASGAALDAAARTVGADAALAGSLVWDPAALGWAADWRLRWRGNDHRWHIAGVSFDQAFNNAMGGAARILSGNGGPD